MRLPDSFTSRMQHLLGDEYTQFTAALEKEVNTSVRINRAKWDHPIELPRVGFCESGYYLKERPVFTLDPFFHSGVYYVQESSSMFLEQAVKACQLGKNVRALDLCAAPGGKSTHLASLISGEGLLISNEVIRSRAQILSENLKKWGNPNVIVTNNDPEDFKRLTGFFDLILVDAPCSGEGLFRRDANAISEWSVDNTQLCAQRQKRILADIWPSLKENGILIYSTCTYNPGENEENIEWLSGFADIEPVKIDLEEKWGITQTEANGIPGYRFYPHKVEGEGFFVAVVRKRDSEKIVSAKRTKENQLNATRPDREMAAKLIDYPNIEFLRFEDSMLAFPENRLADINIIRDNLRIVHAGVKVGEFKQKELLPSHELALSPIMNRGYFPEVPLTIEQSLAYLKRDEIRPESSERGWTLLSYRDIPIGWAKNLGNRFNSAFPKEWRIRMDLSAYQGNTLQQAIEKFPLP